jgi:hypothetical protein
MRASTLSLSAAAVMLLACSDGPLSTDGVSSSTTQTNETALPNAAVYWHSVARSLVSKTASNAFVAARTYALVGVAQHNAAASVNDHGVHAAISAASLVTLTYLFPAEQQALDSLFQQFLAGASQEGANVGRSVGAQVVAYAQTDRFSAPWTGTVPTGPGIWFSSTPPGGATLGQAKTYFLTSGSQFRPVPHPAFGSAAFQDALAEVRRFSGTRTQEQDSIAKYWALPNGTFTPLGWWNNEAGRLITQYKLTERRSAHLFAVMQMVAYDALVASHEAKYTYWLLRPTMADPAITLSIGLPNFPSYPSNHAAISAGMAAILGVEFPSERTRLAQLADQAMLSRVYGGIHYRFDGTAGLTLGRNIAEWAQAHDVTLRQRFPLN